MKKIFLVEDDDGIRELIEYLLISQEYKVNSFPTAEAFKNSLDESLPDLILLDIMLPDGNGLDICKGLGNNEGTKHIPVVLMSAHVDEKPSKENCAKDFIAKPFDVDEFLVKIERQLN